MKNIQDTNKNCAMSDDFKNSQPNANKDADNIWKNCDYFIADKKYIENLNTLADIRENEFIIHIKNEKACEHFCPVCCYGIIATPQKKKVMTLTKDHFGQVKKLNFESGYNMFAELEFIDKYDHATSNILIDIFDKNDKLKGYALLDCADKNLFKQYDQYNDSAKMIESFYVYPDKEKTENQKLLLDYIKENFNQTIFATFTNMDDTKMIQTNGFIKLPSFQKFNTWFNVAYFELP